MHGELSYRVAGLAAAVLAADQISKLAATDWGPGGMGATAGITFGPFGIVPVANPDAIGGWDVGASDFLPLAALVAVAVLIALSRQLVGGSTVGASLAVAGAAGNIVDRLRVGHVIDFLSVEVGRAQVVLNVADLALFVGIPLLLLAGMRLPNRGTGPTQSKMHVLRVQQGES